MINRTIERVRYAETDAMGITHHSTYLIWMELGRTNLIRELGITYRELEESGFMLPVVKLGVKYSLPTQYDDEVVIESVMTEFTGVRMRIDYRVLLKEGGKETQVCAGYTLHAVIDAKTRKIVRPPKHWIDLFQPALKPEMQDKTL